MRRIQHQHITQTSRRGSGALEVVIGLGTLFVTGFVLATFAWKVCEGLFHMIAAWVGSPYS